MAPRRRSPAKRNWPDNLYERNGYFSWKNPLTGREHGIGRDRSEAFEEAKEANLHVSGASQKTRLVHKVTGESDRTVGAWSKKFAAILTNRKLSPNTRSMYASCDRRIVAEFGSDTLIAAVTTLQVSGFIDQLAETMPARALQVRTYTREFFRVAKVKGWISETPVKDMGKIRRTVKRSRLSFEVFMLVYENTRTACIWLHNAMAVGIVSAQRREDISDFETSDWRDGGWYCEQGKGNANKGGAGRGGRKVFIPGSLRLDCFGMSLEDVYKQCRATRIFTKHVIHHTVARGPHCKVGAQVHLDSLTTRFHDEIASLGIDWGDKRPPTFHEIRSLSERLYKAQGGINTTDLLGHKDVKQTKEYDDDRGLDWLRVQVGRAG